MGAGAWMETAMAREGFDPVDPPASESGNPLVAYTQRPAGLGILAVAQFVIAGMYAAAVWLADGWSPALRAVAVIPALVVGLSGVGLLRSRWWGWWLACTVYYILFFNLPVGVILWTVRGAPFDAPSQLLVFVLAVVVLAWLNRSETVRFFRFPSGDGRPSGRMRASPLGVGLAFAVLHLLIGLAR